MGSTRGRLRRRRHRIDRADEPAEPDGLRTNCWPGATPVADSSWRRSCPPAGASSTTTRRRTRATRGVPREYPTSTSSPDCPRSRATPRSSTGTTRPTTHTHEQDDLDIGQLAIGSARPPRPARGRDGARVLPGAAGGDAELVRRLHPDSEGLRLGPGAARGYGRRFQRDRLPLLPGPAARAREAGGPRRGSTARRSSPTRPAWSWSTRPARDHGSFRVAPGGRVDALGRAVPVPAGASVVTRPPSARARPSGSRSRCSRVRCRPSER